MNSSRTLERQAAKARDPHSVLPKDTPASPSAWIAQVSGILPRTFDLTNSSIPIEENSRPRRGVTFQNETQSIRRDLIATQLLTRRRNLRVGVCCLLGHRVPFQRWPDLLFPRFIILQRSCVTSAEARHRDAGGVHGDGRLLFRGISAAQRGRPGLLLSSSTASLSRRVSPSISRFVINGTNLARRLQRGASGPWYRAKNL